MGDHDAYAYWNMLDEVGWKVSVPKAKDYADTYCAALSTGMSEGLIVSGSEEDGLSTDKVRLTLHGAEYHFCPAYF